MRHARMLALAAIVLSALGAARADDAPEVKTYGAWLGDTRIGTVRMELTRVEVDGKPGWRVVTEGRIRMATGAGVSETESYETTEVRDDASVVRSSEREVENGNVRLTRTTYGPTMAVKEVEFLGQTRRTEVKLDGLVHSTEIYLRRMCAEGKMAPGVRFELRDVSFEQERVHKVWLDVTERLAQPDGSAWWRVEQSDELEPDAIQTMVVDATGSEVEGSFGPIRMRRVGEDEHEIPDATMLGIEAVPSTPALEPDAVDQVRRLVVEVQIEHEATLRTDGYQAVEAIGDKRWRLTLGPNRPDVDAERTLPIDDPRFALYLKATEDYESDAPEIKAKAAEIVGDETRAAVVAQKLCEWVFDNLEKAENGAGLTARETLRACKGDCSEHTSLFVALARSVGLPARGMSGLKFSGDAFIRHAWSEVWIGCWIPVDPAWDTVGTTAGYISIGADFDEDGVSRTTALEMAFFGAKARMLEADLGGQVFDASNAVDIWSRPTDPDAVVENVELRSGLRFPGRQVDFADGRLVFQTPYGRTAVARADIARIQYKVGPVGHFESAEYGIAFELPSSKWEFVDPQKTSFLCQFGTRETDAMGVLVPEEYDGTLDEYVEAAKRVMPGIDPESDRREPAVVPAGDEEIPAVRWSFAMGEGSSRIRYEALIVLRGGHAYRLLTWTMDGTYAQRAEDLLAIVGSLRFTR